MVRLLRQAKVLLRSQLAYYGIALPERFDNSIRREAKAFMDGADKLELSNTRV